MAPFEQLIFPMPDDGPADRQCQRCRLWWPLDRFPVTQRRVVRDIHIPYGQLEQARRGKVCKWCGQTLRDERKRRNRFLVKVRTTRRDHARRLHISIADLEDRFGWQLAEMTRSAAHAYDGACGHCAVPYSAMPNGLQDMTLDVIDRAADPMFGINTQWLCMTGNRQKGDMTQAQWAREQRDARRWQQSEDCRQ